MQIKLSDRNLKICGHIYTLKFTNRPLLNQATVGTMSANSLSIEISTIFPQSRQEEAILHEIIEALNFHLDLKLEHSQLSSLSEGLFQVFADNFKKEC